MAVKTISIDLELRLQKIDEKIAKANDKLGSLGKSVGRINSQLATAGKVVKGFGAAILGLAGATLTVKGLTAAFTDAAAMGETLGSLEENFAKLGGSSRSIEEARTNLIGLVSQIDVLKASNDGLIKLGPAFDQYIGQVAELSARMANALGTDSAQQFSQTIDAISKGTTKSLREVGIFIQDTGSKSKNAQAALDALTASIGRLAPVTDSVANAQARMKIAASDAWAEFGKGINANESLTKAFNDLTLAVNDIDWATYGQAVADFAAQLVTVASRIIELISQFGLLKDAAAEVSDLFTSFADQLAAGIEGPEVLAGFRDHMTDIVDLLAKDTPAAAKQALGAFNDIASVLNDSPDWLQRQLATEMDVLREQVEASAGSFGLLAKASEAVAPAAEKVGKSAKEASDGIRGFGDGADEAARKLETLRKKQEQLAEQFDRDVAQFELDVLNDDLDAALKSGDSTAFAELAEKFRQATKEGILRGYEEGVKLGAISPGAADALAQAKADRATTEKIDENARYNKEQMQRSYEDAVGHWSTIFRDAVNGSSLTLEDRLIEIAAGFAAAMETGMTDASEDAFSSIEGILQHVGKKLAGALLSAFPETFAAIGEFFGGTSASGQGTTASGGGSSWNSAAGWQAGVQTGAALWGSWANRDEIDKEHGDNRGTGAAVGGTIGAGIGAFAGPEGAVIGQQIGSVAGEIIGKYISRGSKDAEHQARRQFSGILEDLAKDKNFRFVSSTGQLRTDSNFVIGGTNRFNDPNWSAEVWENYEENAVKAFSGIGEALEEFFEIQEDIGTQMGAAWLEQFGGDIEALKALVDLAGLSYEQFVEIMLERGKKGEASWLEIVSQIQAGAQAWEEGLEGQGQFLQAFDNFIATGGVGQVALNQIKNIAHEAQEAGIKTTDELLAQAEASGKYTAEQIKALEQSFAVNGISTIDQILNATDLQLAQLTASFDAALQDQGVDWEEQKNQLMDINGLLLEIQENSNIELKFNISTEMDGETREAIDAGVFDPTAGGKFISGMDQNLQRFARGGILDGPTIIRPGALAGEAGPEAILPLGRVNGRLGVMGFEGRGGSKPIVFNMDFRGAARGVEQDVQRAMLAVEDRMVSRAVNEIGNLASRGYFGSALG